MTSGRSYYVRLIPVQGIVAYMCFFVKTANIEPSTQYIECLTSLICAKHITSYALGPHNIDLAKTYLV